MINTTTAIRMKNMIILIVSFLLLSLSFHVITVNSNEIYVSISELTNNLKYSLIKPIDNDYVVYGNVENNINSSSWNYMDLIMNDKQANSREQYILSYKAMGFAEGYITCETISQYYQNFASDVFGKDANPGQQTINFIDENYSYLLKMINENKDNDDYWFEIGSLVAQIQGMYEGFLEAACVNSATGVNDYTTLNKPTITHFLLLMSFGDLYQIALKLNEPGMNSRSRGSRLHDTKSHKKKLVERCSALIKVVEGDVIFGHNTWDSYETMAPRIFKHLSIPLFQKNITYNTYFSSSPGLVTILLLLSHSHY